MEMKFKFKKRAKKVASTCIAVEPSERSEEEKKNKKPASLSTFAGAAGKILVWSIRAEKQISGCKSLVAAGQAADSSLACWTVQACRGGKKEGGEGERQGRRVGLLPSSSMLCTEDDAQRLCNNLTSVYSISKVNRASSTAHARL